MGQLMMLMRMLRLLRILRLLRLVKAVRPLYLLAAGVVASMQSMIWVMLLTLTVLYACAILTTRLIGHGLSGGDLCVAHGLIQGLKSRICRKLTKVEN